MKNIETGITGCAELTVSQNELAVNIGSGSLEVLATPVMTMLMEKAACCCLSAFLEDDETTVGTMLNIAHTAATPEGMNVRAEAVLREVNGREFTFDVRAYDEKGTIGEGTHKRFLVFGKKFTEKAKAKLN